MNGLNRPALIAGRFLFLGANKTPIRKLTTANRPLDDVMKKNFKSRYMGGKRSWPSSAQIKHWLKVTHPDKNP
jgi:hypothetical protein